MSQRELEELSPGECLELLSGQTVGRLAYNDDLGPIAEPLNYAVDGDTVVLRVGDGTKRRATVQPLLALEVDRIDPDGRAGWSVIVRGPAEEVPLDEVPALVHQLREAGVDPPRPWAAGVHNVWLRITVSNLSGRRFGREASPLVI